MSKCFGGTRRASAARFSNSVSARDAIAIFSLDQRCACRASGGLSDFIKRKQRHGRLFVVFLTRVGGGVFFGWDDPVHAASSMLFQIASAANENEVSLSLYRGHPVCQALWLQH